MADNLEAFGMTEPVFDSEQRAISIICEQVEKFIDIGQRRRILDYVLDKTVHHIPRKEVA